MLSWVHFAGGTVFCHCGVLGGQAERVPAHRLQHVTAPHAVVARKHVADRVVAHVPHVQLAGGVREHGQAVVLGPGSELLRAEGIRCVPSPPGPPARQPADCIYFPLPGTAKSLNYRPHPAPRFPRICRPAPDDPEGPQHRGSIHVKPASTLSLLAALIAAPAAAASQSVEGTVSPAWVERAGSAERVPLAPGMTLQNRDRVVTGEGSRALLKLADGSAFKLGENATLNLDGLAEKRSDRARRLVTASLDVAQGAFRFTTGIFSKLTAERDVTITVSSVTGRHTRHGPLGQVRQRARPRVPARRPDHRHSRADRWRSSWRSRLPSLSRRAARRLCRWRKWQKPSCCNGPRRRSSTP